MNNFFHIFFPEMAPPRKKHKSGEGNSSSGGEELTMAPEAHDISPDDPQSVSNMKLMVLAEAETYTYLSEKISEEEENISDTLFPSEGHCSTSFVRDGVFNVLWLHGTYPGNILPTSITHHTTISHHITDFGYDVRAS